MFVFVIIVLYGMAYAGVSDEVTSGKKIFIELKCNSCHSIEVEDIEVKLKRKTSIDLSDVNSIQDSDLLVKYLKKTEKINNTVHPVLFKGSDVELNELTTWLKSINNRKCCN
jgi:hypothetical protein